MSILIGNHEDRFSHDPDYITVGGALLKRSYDLCHCADITKDLLFNMHLTCSSERAIPDQTAPLRDYDQATMFVKAYLLKKKKLRKHSLLRE